MQTQAFEIIRSLSEAGPRPAGSKMGEEALRIVGDRLDRMGLNVQRHAFAFERWEAEAKPRLLIDGLGEIPCVAMLGSLGGRFSGRLEPHGTCNIWGMYGWGAYRVREEGGRFSAYVSVRPDGAAISQPVPRGSAPIPHLAVGKESAEPLAHAAAAGSRTEGELRVSRENIQLYNIRAWAGRDTLSEDGTVFLMAHCDTVPESPGAYDNAGGVAALVGVAERLAAGELPQRVQLLFTDAEEFHLAGTRAFVEELDQKDKLDKVAGCLNLDGAGRGGMLDVWLGPEALAEHLHPIVGDHDVHFMFPPPPAGDHYALWEKGLPSIMLTFNDPEILHRPQDAFDRRKVKNAEKMAQLADSIVTKLTEEAIW